MREILFRGKRIDNGEWVEGNFYESQFSGCYIVENKVLATVGGRHSRATIRDKLIPHEIDTSTVGQYTGLKDKNGKRIFEGDIVTRILFDKLYQYEVVYQPDYASFDGIRKGGFISFGNDGDCFEVIGNIHDNPELMEVR